MPSLKSPLGAFGAVGSIKNFVNVVKEVDFEDVRTRAEKIPSIIVVASREEDAHEAAIRLFGERPERYVEIRGLGDSIRLDAYRYDVVIVHDPSRARLLERVRESIGASFAGTVYFLATDLPNNRDPEVLLRAEIVVTQPEFATPLGRFFPIFRMAAAKSIMEETARANAQFALISNVPAIIPVLGGLISASADLVVLTKNQIMMCYKLAALNGRDLHDQTKLITELVPVVGAGFLWRTAAREASSFLPFAAGTVPKVVIAYAGTLAVGWSADFYYRFGKKPTRAQLNVFMGRATEIARSIPLPNRTNGKSIDATRAPGENPTEALLPPSSRR